MRRMWCKAIGHRWERFYPENPDGSLRRDDWEDICSRCWRLMRDLRPLP